MKHYDINIEVAQNNLVIRKQEIERIKQEIISQGMYGTRTNVAQKFTIEERRERAKKAQAEYRLKNRDKELKRKKEYRDRKRQEKLNDTTNTI